MAVSALGAPRLRGWIVFALVAVVAVGLALFDRIESAAAPGERHAAVAADVDDFVFASFDARYELGLDEEGRSVVRVTERIVATFPEIDQNRGIRRAIPERYDGHPVDLDLVSVSGADGAPRAYEAESDDDFLVVTVRADDYLHGDQLYVFEYEMHNVTHVPDDADIDEFYWDVNGTGWAQPFGRVDAEVVLAPELAARMTGDVACYQGPEGSSTPCARLSVDDADPVVVRAGADALRPYENLTVAVGFEPGTVVPRDDSVAASPAAIASIGGGIVGLLALVGAWFARVGPWRDARGRGTIIAEYTPPDGVSLMQSADLVGASGRGITATILDAAVRGRVRIVETAPKHYAVEMVSREGLDPDAARVLDGLFGGAAVPGTRKEMQRNDQKTGRRLHAALTAATAGVTEAGLRRRVGLGIRLLIGALGVVGAVLGLVFGIIALDNAQGAFWPFVSGGVALLAALLVLAFVIDVRPLTERGALAKEHLEGLREYIRLAEADRLRVLQSPSGALRRSAGTPDDAEILHLNERLLPYSVLFKLEKEWSRELAVAYERSGSGPDWYAGQAPFNAAVFAAGVSSFSSAASSSWSGSAASSSSSGSSGGGSSGGGGGGGGGGGV